MVDYSKQTVAQLRLVLKERGIPSTGLQRKAQIIEKLQEADKAVQEAPEPTEASDVEEDAPSDAVEQTTSIPPSTADPPPETIQTIENSAEDNTTVPTEPNTVEPVNDDHGPPTGSDEPVDQKMTEVSDAKRQDETEEKVGVELTDAPELEVPAEPTQSIREDSEPSPALTEKSSIEKPEIFLIPERTTAETSRLNTEELEADSRKRKRRSGTPEIPSQDIRAKKHRPRGDSAPKVLLKEDIDVVMEQRQPEEDLRAKDDHAMPEQKESPEGASESKREKKENSARYRDLINTSTDEPPIEAVVDDRPTVPALHPVTSALYIRDFMRPLRPELLRTHLVFLASSPSSSSDSSIVKSLFLDAMKTHALVSFSTTTAASRVRAALHGSIWPPEGNRKELWVDFIPDDRVEDWIQEEEDAVLAEKEARANGRSLPPKRFEVVYPEANDGSIVAVFQEVSSNPLATASRGPQASIDARRPSTQQQHVPAPSNPAPLKDVRQDIEAPFKTLDQLFRSTEAKPQLFYLPVSDEISDRRLKELDQETSRDWTLAEVRKGRGIKSDVKFKYSFDYEHRIVEVGEDRGPWTEWSEGHRGGRGSYRGRGGGRGWGGGGGGYRSWGRESWRA